MIDYFFVVTKLLGNKAYTIGKPVYLPFKWCHICKEHAFVERAAEMRMLVAPMKDLSNLLCQCFLFCIFGYFGTPCMTGQARLAELRGHNKPA